MKTSTVLSRSLLLVVLLAVSWAAAAPHQADPKNGNSEDQLTSYIERHPDSLPDLLPDLVNKATNIEMTVEDDVLADLLEKKTAQDIEGQDANRGRKKRAVQISLFRDVDTIESGFQGNFQGAVKYEDYSGSWTGIGKGK